MEMSNYRLESHVAQQSRRDKLRIQQNQNQNFQDYTHNSYDPTVFSSEMFNFGANSPVLSATAQPDKQLVAENPSFHSFSHPISAKLSGDPQNCDWNSIVNYSKLNGISQFGDVQFVSSPINYQNTLQEVVTTSHGYSWGDGGNVLALLPSFVDQSDSLRVGDACDGDLRQFTKDNSNTQGLSLSLSSVNPHGGQFGEGYNSEHFYSSRINNANVSVDVIDSKSNLKSEYLCSNHKSPIIVGSPSAFAHRSTGPLGPFTGYATILKSSKFLKPAQNLLDDICSVAGPRPISTSECLINMSEEVGVCPDAKNSNSGGASSSTFYGSNEINSSNESHLPEYQQKKAKLLYMHEEVCKRYKQYHQQMQMVVSSFQSVAGLDAATPYISLALKTISRHFRSLRNAISDQLRDTKTILGEEDLSSPTTGPTVSTSRLKFNNSENGFQKPQRLGGGNAVFFEPQHPAWRPQRGLPERAVSVLRAWLFDHFLHPYPTDTDKHMLATQTGLSRNQVSNWFINARVRVWKPMVEEIHMLETKGSTESSCKTRRPPTGEVPAQQNDSQPENGHGFSNPISERHAEFSGVGPSTCGVGDHGPDPDPWMTREKKSRMECQIPMGMDRSLMGFTPYHRSGLESGGMGPVSLTLGLRQSAESGQEQQFHFGGHMIHDFVG